jgi:hypothetical protein
LRDTFGLKRVNGFSRRFEKRYGEGAIDKFKCLIEDPGNSLAHVAGHFGFSRQYAWEVYRQIYGFPWSICLTFSTISTTSTSSPANWRPSSKAREREHKMRAPLKKQDIFLTNLVKNVIIG